MVTIEQYRQYCAEWTGDPAEFSWLVQHGDIAGVSQRAIADEFEFAPSTVSRWAAGEAFPHKRIQKLVITGLEKKARRLEMAAATAAFPPRKISGQERNLPGNQS
ncbi:MAG: hypothetical protein KGM95_05320 [Betaproteobacteria bacterium]|nr:hypothetical protein [Betaproteobacteria bacterium]